MISFAPTQKGKTAIEIRRSVLPPAWRKQSDAFVRGYVVYVWLQMSYVLYPRLTQRARLAIADALQIIVIDDLEAQADAIAERDARYAAMTPAQHDASIARKLGVFRFYVKAHDDHPDHSYAEWQAQQLEARERQARKDDNLHLVVDLREQA